ncbi:Peptidase M1 membrane alanine aminopeptidase N-terminal [Trinorchestia longiramus]|nr:Peptidase M1 membrane alanine aminopeptidase N-terminal [Trinorchestia longiramus]
MSDGRKSAKSSKALPWEENSRLPETVLPLHYLLYLHPDLDTKLFSGSVSIEMNSTETRDYFLVHSKGLTLSNTQLLQQQPDDSWVPVALLDQFAYTPNEFWVMQTEVPVPAGQYKFSCSFNGSLANNGIVGFYNSTYVNENGDIRELATTKFEPTYARQAFPCFDEPSFKSTFEVTVVRPLQDYIVLSNMPVASQVIDQPSTGLAEVTFEKSVPMVTYLVCFIVSDFIYIGVRPLDLLLSYQLVIYIGVRPLDLLLSYQLVIYIGVRPLDLLLSGARLRSEEEQDSEVKRSKTQK